MQVKVRDALINADMPLAFSRRLNDLSRFYTGERVKAATITGAAFCEFYL